MDTGMDTEMGTEIEFGRDEIRALLEREARRSFRFGAPLFALLHLLEALSHSSEGLSVNVMVPLASAGLLLGLTLYQWRSPVPLQHVSFWVLFPWIVSLGLIMKHVPAHPQGAGAFVTLTLIASAALLLPRMSFLVALVGSLLAQIQSLSLLPGIDPMSLVWVPAFSLAIALHVYTSRRRAIIASERARILERQLDQKQAELVVLVHERESARLESALHKQSEELQESRRSLEAQEHLAALGTVAAGVAHQINNPVGAILAAADFAIMTAEEPDGEAIQTEALKKIRGQAIRCGKIVRSLLKLSKGSSAERKSLELVGCVESAIASVTDGLSGDEGDVQLRVRPGATGLHVLVNSTELEEVFVNLIRNGLESNSSDARVLVDIAPGEHQGILVRVRDNGPGVDPADADRLFEPFFTNRLRKGGTGLGLSVAHRIVADFGGRIWYQPSDERARSAQDLEYAGAEFQVWLPLEKSEE